MHCAGAIRRTRSRLNISGLEPRFGLTKMAAVMIRGALTLAVLSVQLLMVDRPAHAQTESVLYSFCLLGPPYCDDGAYPTGNLVHDSHGNLYGTTMDGGGVPPLGTVFKVTPSGAETVLYSFRGEPDGWAPYYAGVVFDKAGNLYGTTETGGANRAGTVFKLTPTGIETVLHSFAEDGTDGFYPLAGVVLDKTGNLYGTTSAGGASKYGTVFKVTPTGTETVLYSFKGGTDGCSPLNAGVVLGKNGILYGTSSGEGCSSLGTVFELTSTGAETILHRFVNNHKDGYDPHAGLVIDNTGNLYGTTYYGGTHSYGTVFKVTPTRTEKVLHSFTGFDGENPEGSVIRDTAGNIYGTTDIGGASNYGTVFKLTPTGTETVLHTFVGSPADGAFPFAGLVLGTKGILYGTTYAGGSSGYGTVFELVP